MADGKQLPCKGLPPHGKPWGFRPRNEEGFIMTDDDFEEIVLSFEEMLNTDTNELMAEAVKNISEQVEKRYRQQQEKIDVQKNLLKQRRTDNR